MQDVTLSLEGDFISEGDNVVARWKGVATPKGAFGGIPVTGKSATWTGISIFRFAEGKVAEEIGEEDALSVLQQRGVVPPLEPGRREGCNRMRTFWRRYSHIRRVNNA